MFFKWTKILLFIYFEASFYSLCTKNVSLKTVFKHCLKPNTFGAETVSTAFKIYEK